MTYSAELYVKSDVKLFELTSQQNMTEKALTAHIRKNNVNCLHRCEGLTEKGEIKIKKIRQ